MNCYCLTAFLFFRILNSTHWYCFDRLCKSAGHHGLLLPTNFEEFRRNASWIEFLHSGDKSATNIFVQEQKKATQQMMNAQKKVWICDKTSKSAKPSKTPPSIVMKVLMDNNKSILQSSIIHKKRFCDILLLLLECSAIQHNGIVIHLWALSADNSQ